MPHSKNARSSTRLRRPKKATFGATGAITWRISFRNYFADERVDSGPEPAHGADSRSRSRIGANFELEHWRYSPAWWSHEADASCRNAVAASEVFRSCPDPAASSTSSKPA